MLGLIQRVSHASVGVNGEIVGEINRGILLLLGVQREDTEASARKLLHKVMHYRIFPDEDDKMNLNVQQAGGGLLVVSQFTLAADTRKGLRPSFTLSAPPEMAEVLYNYFVDQAKQICPQLATGIFGANMQVSLCNDGPVTFMLES
ncbi:MAG: D-tyrosyl-tRNA(Tyr) deacylase [Porticoccaceae bacterium]|nr:MAG: D-tyrosyl-tRNA(Tyr) deacylase [Porticoccaceae bacterium]